MAKFYGIAGTRRGSVGNETYYISKTQNIVKKKATFVFDPRTVKQITQRSKMKNCILGLKNIKNVLDLTTFANEEVIETHENAFVKNNVSKCTVIDKITSNIPNFPTLSSNVVCSYGTLDTLPVQDYDIYIGVLIEGQYLANKTIGQLSVDLLNDYNFLRNGDSITMVYYFCSNIRGSDERLFEWENENALNNTVEIITGRKTFIINTNDNRQISVVGIFISPADGDPDCYSLSVDVKDENDESIVQTESTFPCYLTVFYARLIEENTYNFCISSMGATVGYKKMLQFAKTEGYKNFSLESWNVNIPNVG